MAANVVTFGEILLRLTPPGNERLTQASTLDIQVGGSEANVAVSLARFGHSARHVTRLPANSIGERMESELRRHGVDVRYVRKGGDRVGLYFLERGSSQRPSIVVYDRRGSAFATASVMDFDWPAILAGAAWFHISGITPALSPECAAHARVACEKARSLGIPISFDLNYRKTLWPIEAARPILIELASHADLILANEEDTEQIFQVHATGADVESGVVPHEAYGRVAKEIAERSGAKRVALTLRSSRGASLNGWAGLLFEAAGERLTLSRSYDIHVVDRVGSGDAFAAGLIHGLLQEWDSRACVEFAVASGCLKHTIPGDLNLVSEGEVLALARGQGAGRVVR